MSNILIINFKSCIWIKRNQLIFYRIKLKNIKMKARNRKINKIIIRFNKVI